MRVEGKQAEVSIFEFFSMVFSSCHHFGEQRLQSGAIELIAEVLQGFPKLMSKDESGGDRVIKYTQSLIVKLYPYFFG